MPAELLVADPGRPILISFERERVNEDWAQAEELNIERACIFEDHPMIKSLRLDVERHKSCIPKLIEGPFEGIGDKGNPLRSNHSVENSPIRLAGVSR